MREREREREREQKSCQDMQYLASLVTQFNNFGWLRGRNVKDAHIRGLALYEPHHPANVVDAITCDPDWKACWGACAGRTIVGPRKLMNLFLIIKFWLPQMIQKETAIFEFGCYRGGSAIFLASLVKRLSLPIKVFGLDTFAGMPKTDKTIDAHNLADFNGVDLDELNVYKEKLGLDNLCFVKGLFSDTLPTLLKEIPLICLAHVDCDIYESIAYAYDTVKPHMLEGGYYVFDDPTEPTCLGATAAVEDLLIRRDGLNSEQIYPHFVFRAGLNKSFGLGNRIRAFFAPPPAAISN